MTATQTGELTTREDTKVINCLRRLTEFRGRIVTFLVHRHGYLIVAPNERLGLDDVAQGVREVD